VNPYRLSLSMLINPSFAGAELSCEPPNDPAQGDLQLPGRVAAHDEVAAPVKCQSTRLVHE